MGTSIFDDGWVDFDPALYGTDDDPVDVSLVRDGVVHNLLHAADQYGQVRVNYVAIHTDIAQDQSTFETVETSPTTGQWYSIGAQPFGPWPLTLRADFTPYRLRVRIAGSISAAGTATFRVVIAPAGLLGSAEIDEDEDHIGEATTTSTSHAYLTNFASASSSNATWLTVTAQQARQWATSVGTFDAVSSASPVSVQQVPVMAHVFAKTTSSSSLPQLVALHVTEFVGPT